VTETIELHGLGGPAGTRLGEMLGRGLEPLAPLGPQGRRFERLVAEVTAPAAALDAAQRGLPPGPARAEAVAQRLRGAGAGLRWGQPVEVAGLEQLLELCRERGRSSVELLAADSGLVAGLQVGSWFDPGRRARRRRRLLAALPARWQRRLALSSPRRLRALADAAFWAGVEERAEQGLWKRLTTASYVVLVYHRMAGEMKPGQERIDISPRRFRRQLAALRLAGHRPLDEAALLAFHGGAELPRRALAITVDDGTADCVGPLLSQGRWRPQLFVPTAEVGGQAHWLDGEPIADWEQLRRLAQAGVGIGSHTRHHHRLRELDPEQRADELEGSLAELRQRLERPLSTLAYPNGDHDEEVCRAASQAGYRAAFTTEKGRNGAGADPYRLRRVSIHGADGIPAVLWKAATGESLPAWWTRWRGRLGGGAS
jgi:peptidoglycan/xylan/chitin deacetylase (PgdA/CDA1 family)